MWNTILFLKFTIIQKFLKKYDNMKQLVLNSISIFLSLKNGTKIFLPRKTENLWKRRTSPYMVVFRAYYLTLLSMRPMTCDHTSKSFHHVHAPFATACTNSHSKKHCNLMRFLSVFSTTVFQGVTDPHVPTYCTDLQCIPIAVSWHRSHMWQIGFC